MTPSEWFLASMCVLIALLVVFETVQAALVWAGVL